MLHWSWVTSFGQKQNCWLCDKQCRERGDQEPGLWNPFLPFDETAQLKLERTTTTTTTQTFAVFTFWWIGTRCSTDWRQHPHSRKKAAQSYPTVWLSPQGPTGESVSPLLMQFFWKNRASLSASDSCSPLSHDTIMDRFITSMTPSWTGLSHHNVSLQRWTTYLFFYQSLDAEHQQICNALKMLDQNDCKVPHVPKNLAALLSPS